MEVIYNNAKSHGKKRNIAIAVIILAVALVISYVYLGTRDNAVTVNQLYDNIIDKNNDGMIGDADLPLAWESYELGDKVVVRDKIKSVSFDSHSNTTGIHLVDYTGKYQEITSHASISVPGDVTDVYHVGDTLTLESKMIEIPSNASIYHDVWTIVE